MVTEERIWFNLALLLSVALAVAIAGMPECSAAQGPFEVLTAPEVIARMGRSHEAIVTICGTFREVHRLELMERPILTHGRFWGDGVARAVRKDIVSGDPREDPPRPAAELIFAAADKRLEPIPLLAADELGAAALATMDRAQIYYPKEKRLEVYHLDPKEMEHLFFLNLLLRPQALMEGFAVSVRKAPLPAWPEREAVGASFYALALAPKKKEMRAALNAVTLYIDPKDFFPRAIEQSEPTGDRTVLVMEEVRVNWPFPPAVFLIDPAAGTKRSEFRVGAFLK